MRPLYFLWFFSYLTLSSLSFSQESKQEVYDFICEVEFNKYNQEISHDSSYKVILHRDGSSKNIEYFNPGTQVISHLCCGYLDEKYRKQVLWDSLLTDLDKAYINAQINSNSSFKWDESRLPAHVEVLSEMQLNRRKEKMKRIDEKVKKKFGTIENKWVSSVWWLSDSEKIEYESLSNKYIQSRYNKEVSFAAPIFNHQKNLVFLYYQLKEGKYQRVRIYLKTDKSWVNIGWANPSELRQLN